MYLEKGKKIPDSVLYRNSQWLENIHFPNTTVIVILKKRNIHLTKWTETSFIVIKCSQTFHFFTLLGNHGGLALISCQMHIQLLTPSPLLYPLRQDRGRKALRLAKRQVDFLMVTAVSKQIEFQQIQVRK